LLSDLRSNSALGPVPAIGIALAMLAALTFLPAVLYALGRAVFWPRRPAFEGEALAADALEAAALAGTDAPTGAAPVPAATTGAAHAPAAPTGWWARLAAFVARRPRAVCVATTAVLALATLGATQLRAGGVPQSELILGGSEAKTGQELLAQHFPGGAGSPVYVLVPAEEMQA